LAAVAGLGAVVTALEQPRVNLGVRAAVDRQERLEDRRDRDLPSGGRDDAPGEPVTDPAAVMRALAIGRVGGRARDGRERGVGVRFVLDRCH
jgi:hypothetical protein